MSDHDPSINELLALTKQTHEMVSKLHRHLIYTRILGWFKFVLWVVILGASVWFSLPYLKLLQDLTGPKSPLGSLLKGGDLAFNPNDPQIQALIKQFAPR